MGNSKKGFIGIALLIILGLLIVGGGAYYIGTHHNATVSTTASTTDEYSSASGSLTIQTPQPNAIVRLPVDVKGTITKSGWSIFEGQAGTVQIFDANNIELGVATPLKVTGNNYDYTYPVQVEAMVGDEKLMSNLKTSTGYLRFTVENAKGDPNPEHFDMPVKFGVSTNSTTTTIVSTNVGWETYTNTQYGFQFQYPSQYVIYHQDKNSASIASDNTCTSIALHQSPGDYTSGCFYISINVQDNKITSDGSEKQNIQIGNLSSEKITTTENPAFFILGQVQRNNKWYVISVTSNVTDKAATSNFFNQIIASFKFTN